MSFVSQPELEEKHKKPQLRTTIPVEMGFRNAGGKRSDVSVITNKKMPFRPNTTLGQRPVAHVVRFHHRASSQRPANSGIQFDCMVEYNLVASTSNTYRCLPHLDRANPQGPPPPATPHTLSRRRRFRDVILLLEHIPLNLRLLQKLEISVCPNPPPALARA